MLTERRPVSAGLNEWACRICNREILDTQAAVVEYDDWFSPDGDILDGERNVVVGPRETPSDPARPIAATTHKTCFETEQRKLGR